MDKTPTIDLYNFDHGFSAPKNYRFGPYEFLITEEDVAALSQLTRNARTNFKHDESHHPVVERADSMPGRIVKTATARMVDRLPHVPNQLKAGVDDEGFGDLALLLSFLTGRRVLVSGAMTKTESSHYGDSVVGGNYFHCNGLSWPRIDLIAEQGLGPALWAVVNGKQVRDGIGLMLYASSAFDAISTRWAKTGISKRPCEEKEGIKAATEAIKAVLEESFENNDLVTSCKNKVASIFEVSAVVKTTEFLASIGLVDLESHDSKDRVALINRVRNMVVHNADIPRKLHDDERRRAEIAGAIMIITMEIACLSLADVACVNDYQVEISRRDLRCFFDTGVFRKQRVFEESYEQFSARMEEEWTFSNSSAAVD
ncbi:hypothetical protein BI317_16765 [Xanthomonas hortorum pv. gardneri]|uniref:hypothetical protein n=1 Tax=Xanthomonas hortorum TaxID=56454 RepID=UPI000938136C|nr:hypothetical protein [Xanthomonas hortorum]APP85578.1 hypothetical protein BI317_16765 [Xanthomonas hortorum pv. gardneri]